MIAILLIAIFAISLNYIYKSFKKELESFKVEEDEKHTRSFMVKQKRDNDRENWERGVDFKIEYLDQKTDKLFKIDRPNAARISEELDIRISKLRKELEQAKNSMAREDAELQDYLEHRFRGESNTYAMNKRIQKIKDEYNK